jgi:hypothetical protein
MGIHTSATARVLDRLDGVRPTGNGCWIAKCPAHPDRSPSLSIRDANDRVLLHCFAGCDPDDVLAAIGLGLKDLFERPLAHHVAPIHSAIPARDLLVLLDHEIVVAVLILDDVIRRRAIKESELSRLMQASALIGQARDLAAPAKVSHAA